LSQNFGSKIEILSQNFGSKIEILSQNFGSKIKIDKNLNICTKKQNLELNLRKIT